MTQTSQPPAGATPPTPSPGTPPAAASAPAKFVGKYETQADFEKGIRELAKVVEFPLPEDQPVIGENGRFKTIDEATAAYKALARIQSRQAPATPPASEPPKTTPPAPGTPGAPGGDLKIEQPKVTADADVSTILAAVGVTAEDITGQWTAGGKLDDATYAKFAAKGYPRALVDGYLRGQQAEAQATVHLMQSVRQTVQQSLGGEQAESTLREFARTMVGKDAAFDALNERVNTDPRVYPALMQYVASKHAEAVRSNKTAPLASGGAPANPSSGEPFANRQDYFDTVRAAGRGDPRAIARLKAHGRLARR